MGLQVMHFSRRLHVQVLEHAKDSADAVLPICEARLAALRPEAAGVAARRMASVSDLMAQREASPAITLASMCARIWASLGFPAKPLKPW